MELKNEAEKASPFGRGGGEADGEGKTALSPAIAGALPEGELSLLTKYIFQNKDIKIHDRCAFMSLTLHKGGFFDLPEGNHNIIYSPNNCFFLASNSASVIIPSSDNCLYFRISSTALEA